MRITHRTIGIAIGLIVFAVVINGCGSGEPSPVVPGQADVLHPQIAENPETEITQWGTWIIRCTDATGDEPASVEAIPHRSGEAHVDVAGLLLPPKCSNCLDISIQAIEGDVWTLLIELTNPTVLSAYDVMGVFPGVNCPQVHSPDSYTDLYDVDADPSTHNPYKIFNTGNPDNEWGPGEQHSQMMSFQRDDGQKFTEMLYVVAVSWPENQSEILKLANPQATGPLYTDASNSVNFTVEVQDWQDDIEYVVMDLSPLNGSEYTHMQDMGEGLYQVYSYAAYGLSPGTTDLLIAAKSEGSDYLTFNYLTVEVTDPPEPTTKFELLTGPVDMTGEGAPVGEMDIAVVGKPGGGSTSLVYASTTQIYHWNTDYSTAMLYLTLVDTTGDDPNFPIEPVSRIATTDPVYPSSIDQYSILQTNLDPDIWDDTPEPDIFFKNTLQILDMETLQAVDFNLTADNVDTPELDAILYPVDVTCGVNDNKYGYALWAPDGGAYPGFYPYISLIRYEPPYEDGGTDYDTLLGGISDGTGDGKVESDDVNGVAIWDGGGDGSLFIAISEGNPTNEVELFTLDYITNPGGALTPVDTISGFAGSPLDVVVLPVGDAGVEEENWVCILTEAKTIEVYTVTGDFVVSVYDTEAIPYVPTHMDADFENLRLHVLMEGPRASVLQYTGD